MNARKTAASALAAAALAAGGVAASTAPASADGGGGVGHGWCTFRAGSTTVSVETTRTSYRGVRVDIYAGRNVHVQATSVFAFPMLHMAPGYGTHLVRHEELNSPAYVRVRATRGGDGDSCDAPITSWG